MPNHRPSAANDFLSFNEEDAIAGNLLSNDSDPDGSPLFLRFLGGVRIEAKFGADQITTVQGTYGTFAFKPDGSFTYLLDQTLEEVQGLSPGEMLIEQFQYKMSDGLGGADVALLRVMISGHVPGAELRVIDFEDLPVGSTVPDGYQEFTWAPGWTVATDTGGEMDPGNHVASPPESVETIGLVSGANFDLASMDLKPLAPGESIRLDGFDDGVSKFSFLLTTFGPDPSHIDLQWEGLDQLQITSPHALIDTMTVVVPAL